MFLLGPMQPGSISTFDVGLTSISISWDDAGGQKDFYIIYATDLTTATDRVRKGRVNNDVTTFIVDELIPDTDYRIEVEAVSGTEDDNKPSTPRQIVQTTSKSIS